MIDTLILIVFFIFPVLLIICYILWINRCPNGGQHKYESTNGRFVKGNDIGFGITNSFRYKISTCIKCGHSFESN